MIAKLYNFWTGLRDSLWFIPAVFCLFYFAFTLGLYFSEIHFFPKIDLPSIFFSGSAGDAKSVTIALLSSMITMATLAISITMVVLSLAASQLGPRLIKTFMSDRKTQCYIGLFFGAVVACFMLTVILHDSAPKAIKPQITISMVFVMCFANLFVLLTFVHHVATSSIADNVILRVSDDLVGALDRLTRKENEVIQYVDEDKVDWPKDFQDRQQCLYFERFGYIQYINYQSLVEIASNHGLYIEVHFKAGHFIIEGEDGVRLYPKDKVTEEIEKAVKDAFIMGKTRTATQDIEYSIRHLVEVALRALSPGINDSFTAITVLDHLSAAIGILFQKDVLLEWTAFRQDKARLWAKQNDEQDLMFSAFDQIHHNIKDKPDIIYHLLKKLKILCELAKTSPQRAALKRQLDVIEFDLNTLEKTVQDITPQKVLCNQLLAKLKE